MPRDIRVYLEDILEAIAKIERFYGYDDFLSQIALHDAILFNLQIIGEAVKQLPGEIRDEYPEVEWWKIAGLRDLIVHQYFNISDEIIEDIIENHLPFLQAQIRKIYSNLVWNRTVVLLLIEIWIITYLCDQFNWISTRSEVKESYHAYLQVLSDWSGHLGILKGFAL